MHLQNTAANTVSHVHATQVTAETECKRESLSMLINSREGSQLIVICVCAMCGVYGSFYGWLIELLYSSNHVLHS